MSGKWYCRPTQLHRLENSGPKMFCRHFPFYSDCVRYFEKIISCVLVNLQQHSWKFSSIDLLTRSDSIISYPFFPRIYLLSFPRLGSDSLETSRYFYTGCNRRNGPDFGRVFLRSNYTDITQNTYIQRWTVSEIMASEVWIFDSCYTLTDYQIHIETGRNMWFL